MGIHSNALHRSWIALGCLAVLPAVYGAEPACDPRYVQLAAKSGGYQKTDGKPYCEGLIEENNSSDLQIVSLMSASVLGTARSLVLRSAKAEVRGKSVRISGSSRLNGIAYRFDSVTSAGESIELDLARTQQRITYQLPAEDLLFFGSVEGSRPRVLVPILLGQSPDARRIRVGVRVPVPLKEYRYRLSSPAGDGPWMEKKETQAAGIVYLELRPASAGSYRLDAIFIPDAPITELGLSQDLVSE